MKLNFIDPEVKLVGSYDGRARAWRFSRQHIKSDDQAMNDIRNLNLPVNGFANYHFEIKGSVLFRDFCYCCRPSNNWARSSRAELITEDNMRYSSEFKDVYTPDNKEFVECHINSVDQSIPQDIRKKYFPYGFVSDFSIVMNARVLSNFLNTIKGSVFNNYYDLFINCLNENGIDLVPHDKFNLWNQLCIPNSGLALDSNVVYVHHDKITNQVTIAAKMTGALSSQFQRQESGIVKLELINRIQQAKSLKDVPVSQDFVGISMVIVPYDVAVKIASTRSCWFSRMDRDGLDSWSRIVVAIIDELKLSVKDLLPCEGQGKSKCPYLVNQLNTIPQGNPKYNGDVMLPCPYITGVPEVYEMRKKEFNSDSLLFKSWRDWIPNMDITQEGIEFINNVSKYGYAEKHNNEILKDETKKMLNKYNKYIENYE